jgi:predicted DCC family thiol-disulfide oxidoreductase YuxK
MSAQPLTLFYDGLCPLCSREIAHYRRHLPDQAASFLDITGPDFDARQHGLDPGDVQRVMHVKVGAEVRTGVDAFVAIWDAIPRYRWAARLARLPVVRPLLGLGYALFARVRPLLPRRKREDCSTGTCRR